MLIPPARLVARIPRPVFAYVAIILVLLMLANCDTVPLQHATTSPSAPSATPISSLSIYAALNADREHGTLVVLHADSGGLRWQTPLDAVGGMSVGATLGEGVIYAASRDVFAVATHDGTLLWHTPLAGIVYDPPTVADGVLFVPRAGYTQGDVSRNQVEHVDPSVFAVQARTGSVLWRSLEIVGQVVISNGIVYGRSNDLTQLLALRATNGTVLWRVSLGGGLFRTPVLVGGTLYAATLGGDVLALRTSDGSLRWKAHLADRILAGLAVSHGVLYTALSDRLQNEIDPTHDTLVALRAADGAPIWRVPNGQQSLGTPVIANSVLYARDGDGLSAWRASDGTLLWHVRAVAAVPVLATLTSRPEFLFDTPVMAADTIFAALSVYYFPHGSHQSVLVALDARTGVVRWRYPQNDVQRSTVGWIVVGP